MTELRVWYPARDLYHCAFRIIRILCRRAEALPIDQLRLLDMLLMYPTLALRMKLPSEVRERARALRLPSEKSMFVQLPGTASIWQDLQLYQSAAVNQLAGRGLLTREALRDRQAVLDADHVPQAILDRARTLNETEADFMNFLIDDIAGLPTSGSDSVFKRAAIPARGPVA